MARAVTVSDQRPGLRAWEDSVGLPFHELVSWLRDILGVALVVYIGGVKSTRAVSDCAAGAAKPGEIEWERLQQAFHTAALLRERYDAVAVQSWFKGLNPRLDDAAPAQILAAGDPAVVVGKVLAAAKSFAYVG